MKLTSTLTATYVGNKSSFLTVAYLDRRRLHQVDRLSAVSVVVASGQLHLWSCVSINIHDYEG